MSTYGSTYEVYVIAFITQGGRRGLKPDDQGNPHRFQGVEEAYAVAETLTNAAWWDILTLDQARDFTRERTKVPVPSGR